MRALFRQFSFPGGIPSHVAPETPGSIHEGGELGYALSHAYGAAFDNPELIVACVIGDGEAETGSARDELAFEQVPESGARWRRAADPASERLQDRGPHRARAHSARGAGAAAAGLRLRAALRRPRSRSSAATHLRHGAHARPHRRAHSRHSGASASRRLHERPRWPTIVLQTPEGLDRPERSRRHRRSKTPGARTKCRLRSSPKSRRICVCSRVDAQLSAGRAVHERRRLRPELARARAGRPAPHERQPARERRHAAARSAAAGFSQVCRRARASRREHGAKRRACRARSCATS